MIPPHLTCVAALPCGTVMSEIERQSQINTVINDKLQGTVATCLMYSEIFSIQIKQGLLLSLRVKRCLNQ